MALISEVDNHFPQFEKFLELPPVDVTDYCLHFMQFEKFIQLTASGWGITGCVGGNPPVTKGQLYPLGFNL